jgi:hypothetical protein
MIVVLYKNEFNIGDLHSIIDNQWQYPAIPIMPGGVDSEWKQVQRGEVRR